MFRAQWRSGTETYVKHTRADRMQAIAEKDKYSNGDTSYWAAALCMYFQQLMVLISIVKSLEALIPWPSMTTSVLLTENHHPSSALLSASSLFPPTLHP